MRLYAKVGYPNWSLDGGRSLIGSAVQMADVARQRPVNFEDLEFYPNDGTATRPPAPGNLLIFAAAPSNGGYGHVAIVNSVSEEEVSFVQQNHCVYYDGLGLTTLYDSALIEVALKQGQQTFRVVPQETYSAVVGWIHSKRIKERLIDQPRITLGKNGGLSWNADDTTIYLYFSPELTRLYASDLHKTLKKIPDPPFEYDELVDKTLEELPDRAFAFTHPGHVNCVLDEVRRLINGDRRLNPRNGVRSVDIAIKYTGYMHWLRPWGGPASKKWFPFIADCFCITCGK